MGKTKWYEESPGVSSFMRIGAMVGVIAGALTIAGGLGLLISDFLRGSSYSSVCITAMGIGSALISACLGFKMGQSGNEK
jgi:hypothetical protein